jgi:Predicted pyridoxal phosphate-dependent enzyme apparently involved in regulation of cell wall biogenesis
MSIYVTKPSMPSLEEYIEEIKPIFESHILTNMGPMYKEFQHKLMEYLEVPSMSLFVNGHMALEMALQALDMKGEVITTPFTFASTTHAIVRAGLTPVFCDIKESDYTIDETKIEELITDKTCAIVPVHVYGHICNVEEIERIAKKHNLKVIYDAAHAFGCKYKGIGVGNFGDISMFSFHATKVFNSIEGGGIVYHDNELKGTLHSLKNFGIYDKEDIQIIGANAKLDELRSAMGICNLRHVDDEIQKRKEIFDFYCDKLSGIDGLTVSSVQDNVTSNFAYFPVRIDGDRFGKTRDDIFQNLKQHDIHARKYFSVLTCDFPCYKGKYKQADLPVARKSADNIICLPIYGDMSAEDVCAVCNCII